MSYEVLARKWRPQVFKDVIGQEHITDTLLSAIRSDRTAHAYLFSGARGVGKTSVARILARALNCLDLHDGNPCNRCRSCQEITGGSSVDVQEIDGASNRGIDEIRELRDNIKFMPSSSKFRVYIIDEVHMLTLQAFNALLKTLEEPPPHVKFIFATTEPHKVPVTILSRCQRFDFKRIPLFKLVEQLKKISLSEGIEISEKGLTLIAREAEGSMRDAESLLDQVASFAGTRIEDNRITEILGIIDRDLLFETSEAVIAGDPGKCLELVDKIYYFGYDIKEFYRALMDQFRNLTISLITENKLLIDLAENDREELSDQAKKAGLERLQQSLNILIAQEGALRSSSHPKLILETLLVKLCGLGHYLSFEQILQRIEGLEKRLISTGGEEVLPARISDADLRWDSSETETSEPGETGNELTKSEWSRFLDSLSSKNRPMARVLSEWIWVDFTKNRLTLKGGDTLFSSTYLDDEERLAKLTRYCRDFFKKPITIQVAGNERASRPAKGKKKAKENSHKPDENGEMPKPVQEVLRAFGGEIKGEYKSE
jgi:DNA polymerase-3 subunit gamma/tau